MTTWRRQQWRHGEMMQCMMFLANHLSARIHCLPKGTRAAITVSPDVNSIQSIQEVFVTQLAGASGLGSWISSSPNNKAQS